MKKYESIMVEVKKACPYCGSNLEYKGIVYGKPGQMEQWECSDHGGFYEVTAPMSYRGSQYTGWYNPSGRNI